MRSASPQQIGDLINYWGNYYNFDPRLARAVFQQESSLDPNIKDSSAGAQGLAQIMPETQRHLGIDDPYDVNQAIRGGIQYLQEGYQKALAANSQNPAAGAVRYYNPGGGTDYLRGVAQHYRGLPAPVDAIDGVAAGPGAGAASAAPAARWSVGSQVQGQGLSGVDPRLVDIASRASGYLPDGWRAEMVSGYRPGDPRFHGEGKAVDVQLYDSDGNRIPNYQDGRSFRLYEEYAQNARKIQSTLYPELNDQFRWGGYFWNGGKGQYGASDQMHLDIGGSPTLAGDWEGGLSDVGRRGGYDAGGAPSQGMGNIAQFQLPQSQGNVAVAAHPAGNAVVARSLPDEPPPAAAAPPTPGPAAELVSSPTQPVWDPTTLKFRQVPRPGPVAAETGAPQAAVTAPERMLSDEAIGKMGPSEAAMAGTQENLTDADRRALIDRLSQLQQQPAAGT